MIRVPLLTPRLSSWWLRLVTPLQARVGRELIEGVRHATVVSDDLALRRFAIRPAGIRKAIADALPPRISSSRQRDGPTRCPGCLPTPPGAASASATI